MNLKYGGKGMSCKYGRFKKDEEYEVPADVGKELLKINGFKESKESESKKGGTKK